ncbi:uncharacterized protein SAMN05421505_13011 [Sinosporangium album]|uniref:DUF418 domain-containing protein n=1 Tax=Sinosporangium album TaxID=504805 RepID=A0A1G8H0V2_9ACTN|nr:DUF418 domain-containing protein [Sinosporangium album]SDI00288.1 uncharacterized protein SAMN05421505_13011 [Sinosporangium album]
MGYAATILRLAHRLTWLALAAAIYLIQLRLSLWRTANHRYGPIEWLLRKATYGPRHRPTPTTQ